MAAPARATTRAAPRTSPSCSAWRGRRRFARGGLRTPRPPLPRLRTADRLGQLLDRRLEVARERVEVAHGVVIADEAEVDGAVVAHDPETDALVARQRHHRVDRLELAAHQVQRELRAGDVGDDEVEE